MAQDTNVIVNPPTLEEILELKSKLAFEEKKNETLRIRYTAVIEDNTNMQMDLKRHRLTINMLSEKVMELQGLGTALDHKRMNEERVIFANQLKREKLDGQA